MAKSSKPSAKKGTVAANYEKHVPEEPVTTVRNAKGPGLTFLGKLGLFLGFPFLIGLLGLYSGYASSLREPGRKVDFDRDFIMPFLLALAMVVVIGMQTNGFSKKEVDPLVKWPKVKRVKKIVRKEEEGNTEQLSSKKDNWKVLLNVLLYYEMLPIIDRILV